MGRLMFCRRLLVGRKYDWRLFVHSCVGGCLMGRSLFCRRKSDLWLFVHSRFIGGVMGPDGAFDVLPPPACRSQI